MNTNHVRLIVGLTFALACACAASAAGVTVIDLRCEYRENPLGIDAAQPRLSWILESAERGQKQTAYQVLVASTEANLAKDTGDRWDSGKVASDQSIHVPYQGKALRSEAACFWKVRVWDKDGAASPWSAPASWTMGLLKASDWKGQWIGLDREDPSQTLDTAKLIADAQWIWVAGEPGKSAPPAKRYFRREVALPKGRKVTRARLFLAADNGFEAHLNGKRIGRGSSFSSMVECAGTESIQPGTNTIAVEVENFGDGPNPAGLIGFFLVEFAEGEPLVILTDAEWRGSKTADEDWKGAKASGIDWSAAEIVGPHGCSPWGAVSGGQSEFRRLSARYLRREFTVGKEVKRATAYVCGMGLFELHVNGKKVGDHVLEPGLTQYDARVFYETFDITNRVASGKNALGVILGNGRFYAPRIKTPVPMADFGYPKLLLQARIDYTDGTSETIVSDASWKLTTKGPIRTNNEYDGEEYDARMEMPGWDTPGFDAAGWKAPQLVEAPGGRLDAQSIEPIRVTETLSPVAITNPKPGMYIVDMGQNMVGWCRLTVQGPAGTAVKLRHAEVLKDDGTLYLDNIRGAKVTDIYTLKGQGVEVYEPRFTYHGFRYVEVTGFPGTPTRAAIQGRVVHDDMASAGAFTCSNKLLNRIRRNIFWGTRGNYRSFPTDCPQRDERQAWLGDRGAEARGETYLFDVASFYAKWMADIKSGQREDGAISSVVPTYWAFYPNDVTWPSAFTLISGTLYDQYGDLRVIEDCYPSMKRWMEHMKGFMKDGIMPQDNYGDWCCPPESPELIHSKDPKRKTPKEVLGSTYFYKNLRLMERYATLLGKTDEAKQWGAEAEALKKAFNEKFFDAEKLQYGNGSQTSYVLPLSFGMVPEQYHKRVFERLVDKIVKETDGHIGTGLIGGQWLMRVLSDNGRPDVAYTIATQTTYPSWGYMLEKDATTIWELWNGDTANPAMNSHNHVMLVGDLNTWFTEYLAGIQADPAVPAFKRIIMRPRIVGDLTSATATYNSPYGVIASAWKRSAGTFSWEVTVPPNTTATVYVPAREAGAVRESGQPLSAAEGITFLRMEDGAAVLAVQPGAYRFESKIAK